MLRYKKEYYAKKVFIKLLYWVHLIDKQKYLGRRNKYRRKYKICSNQPELKKIDIHNYEKDNYLNTIFERNKGKSTEFVEINNSNHIAVNEDTKIIAWYLPQFHQMEVNDRYHGKGFTEWTNVAQAIPMYTGQYQPQIPYDVGFYDLLNPNTFKRQIELAKKYGIYGFCFHWYWFSGERTMEKPLELFLSHKELDIRFCLDWATENWTTAWDGEDRGIIFEQKMKKGDDKKLFQDLLPYFKDSRYIKINNKPILCIYNAKVFDQIQIRKMLLSMKNMAKENGFSGIYVMLCNGFGMEYIPEEWGADALVEFPPAGIEKFSIDAKPEGFINPNSTLTYRDFLPAIINGEYLYKHDAKKYFRSALVSFDNTARKAYSRGRVCLGLSPDSFKLWLNGIILESKKIHSKEEDIVFVNSWNEWAEGSHLEPDYKYGYAYLQAVRDALENSNLEKRVIPNLDLTYVDREFIKKSSSTTEKITFVVFCSESMGDVIACEPIARYLKNTYKDVLINWIINKKYIDIVRWNPYIDKITEIDYLSQGDDYISNLKKRNSKFVLVDCHFNGRESEVTHLFHKNSVNPIISSKNYFYFGDSLLDIFAKIAGIEIPDLAPKFYLSSKYRKIDNNEQYVVIHCKSSMAVKDWPQKNWNKLVNCLITHYKVYEIGVDPVVHCQDRNFIQLCGTGKSIQDLAYLIKNSSLFIGVDSGFAHIANCFNRKSVLLFGKYLNFDTRNVYSGEFSHSNNFNRIDSPYGEPVTSISVDKVLEKCNSLLKINK